MVFLQSDEINDLLGSFKIVDDDPQDKREKMLIIDHALVIMNRCLGYQVEALITDQISALVVMTIIEDKEAQFGVNKALQDLLWNKFKVMIEQASEAKTNSNESRFCSLHYMMQAFVNMLILSKEQQSIVSKVVKNNCIGLVLKVLMNVTPHIL